MHRRWSRGRDRHAWPDNRTQNGPQPPACLRSLDEPDSDTGTSSQQLDTPMLLDPFLRQAMRRALAALTVTAMVMTMACSDSVQPPTTPSTPTTVTPTVPQVREVTIDRRARQPADRQERAAAGGVEGRQQWHPGRHAGGGVAVV